MANSQQNKSANIALADSRGRNNEAEGSENAE